MKKTKIIRKEYYIIETTNEIYLTNKQLKELTQLDEESQFFYLDELFMEDDGYVSVYEEDEDKWSKHKFILPEQSEPIGYMDLIEDDKEVYLINNELNDVKLENNYLIDKENVKTFYWDFKDLKKTDFKSYLRHKKINSII